MKQPRTGRVFCQVVCWLVVSCVVAGCATPAAPGFSGRWTPVNRFDLAPEEIPLSPAYQFFAAPMDRTLKTMLARWALDSKLALVYQHPSDFTLYEPVSHIRTGDLHAAIAALNQLYATKNVAVSIEVDAIVVRRVEQRVDATPLSPRAAANRWPKAPTGASHTPSKGANHG